MLGAAGQEQKGCELPQLGTAHAPCHLPRRGRARAKGTVSPAPQSVLGNAGHSDLQRQLEKEKMEELRVGNSAWAGGGLRSRGGSVCALPGQGLRAPQKPPGLEAGRAVQILYLTADKNGPSPPLSLNTAAENVCHAPSQVTPNCFTDPSRPPVHKARRVVCADGEFHTLPGLQFCTRCPHPSRLGSTAKARGTRLLPADKS